MARCCEGKNAYKPIGKIRYILGLLIFYGMHLQCRIFMSLRHAFLKRFPKYKALVSFHNAYFKDTCSQIFEHKGMSVKTGFGRANKKIKISIFLCFCLFVFFNYLFRFDGPAVGYWDTYITEPALFIANQHIDFVSKDGENLYTYTLPGKLPENLVNLNADGISTKDQRLGTAIIFSPWFVFFNIFGFRLFFSLSAVVIAVFVFLTTQLLFKRFSISMISAIIACLNSYVLSINNLNPNITGMMLASMLIYLLIKENPNGFIIGLVYGTLGGIRNEGILFFPAIIYQLFASSDKKIREIILCIIGTIITIMPILYWNYYAFGDPFMHPTQFPALGGFRPVFEHKFLFWKFNFNGMLNYPFYHKIIRTPYFALPTFLLLPLTLASSLGIILFALAFSGGINLYKQNKKVFIFTLSWLIPMYFLLSVQENWSNLKMTFLLMCLNPIMILIGSGLDELSRKEPVSKKIIRLSILCVIILALVKLFYNIDFEVDQRWYVRFPRAIEGKNISYIGDDLRTKKEDLQEVLAQKRDLTRGNLFPRINKTDIVFPDKIATIKKEMKQKSITVVDIWRYIYEK